MTKSEATRAIEREGRIIKLPAGNWRAKHGAIYGYGSTREKAIGDAAHKLMLDARMSDPWRGTYGEEDYGGAFDGRNVISDADPGL